MSPKEVSSLQAQVDGLRQAVAELRADAGRKLAAYRSALVAILSHQDCLETIREIAKAALEDRS